MNRNKILLLAILLAGVTAMLRAAEFTMNVSGDGLELSFGLAQNAAGDPESKVGLPPVFAPAINAVVYLEGPGELNYSPTIDENFSMLSRYIKEEADSALWKLVVERATGNVDLTFKFSQGVTLPEGSYLKIYPEDDAAALTDLTNGETQYKVEVGKTYIIDYRSSESKDPGLLAPVVRTFEILRSNDPKQLVFKDIPASLVLKAGAAVTAYKLVEKVDGGDVSIEYTKLGDDYGTVAVNDDVVTLTLTKNDLADVARVQFAYWYENANGSARTEEASVIVNVNDGISLTMEKRLNVADLAEIQRSAIAIIPDEEGYDGTYLVYKVELAEQFRNKELTYLLFDEPGTPGKDPYEIQYAFASTGDSVPAAFDELAAAGAAHSDGNTSFYLWLKVKAASSNSENREVTPLVKDGDAELGAYEKTTFVIISSGTMDIDGNGVITEDDAIMMYNFIALGGIDDPESMFVDDIIQGIDETQVDAEAALAVLKSLAAFLDYDENGFITEDDAIMMYNFIALGGIDDPESMFVDDIIQGIDETQVDAEKALENFKKYASK